MELYYIRNECKDNWNREMTNFPLTEIDADAGVIILIASFRGLFVTSFRPFLGLKSSLIII